MLKTVIAFDPTSCNQGQFIEETSELNQSYKNIQYSLFAYILEYD